MSFFFVDDQLQANRKVHDLIETDGAAGAAAVGLWTMAGSLSKAKGSDGVMTDADLVRLLLDRRLAGKLARLLVRVALWHGTDHACPVCPAVPRGSYVFHDWFQFKYAQAAKERVTRDRRKELKDEELREAVWARDGDGTGAVGWCRYCAHVVRRKDNKSPRQPVLDHVTPGVARGLDNLVLACQTCNREKGGRTPEQAGMPVLPAPTTPGTNTDITPESTSISTSISTRSESGKRGPHKGDGDGAGDGSDLGTGDGQLSGWLGAPAGAAPPVATPDRGGSPWFGHAGPYIDDPPEARCQIHHSHLPCAQCASERYDREADQ